MKWEDEKSKLPSNGTVVHVLEACRYLHYKPNSQQAKRGVVGRWQRWDGYGFKNCEPPVAWTNDFEQKQGESE